MALRGGDRYRQHRLHIGERGARLGQQAVLDVEHHLALDQQIVTECQLVLRQVDRALDRVLDGHESEIDLAGLDGVEHIGHRAVQHVLGRGEVGLRLQRLLGERAERARGSRHELLGQSRITGYWSALSSHEEYDDQHREPHAHDQ